MTKEEDKKIAAEKERKILIEARDRLAKGLIVEGENKQNALNDLEFIAVEGKQWPAGIRAQRIAEKRPCITVNKMAVFIDQVVGDQRMNRPSIKVVPVDSKADVKTAKIIGGWIKHVQQISKSDIAIDHGFEHAVACGYGAWRVVTKYVSDDSFDQEACIEKIDNALSVIWGQHTEYDCSDAVYCFVISDMDKEEFKSKYGEDPMPFNTADSQYVDGWVTKDTVRVAEYFVKEPIKKKLYLLESGETVDIVPTGQKAARERDVVSYKIMWYLLTGNKIIESREWVGKKYIPIIPVWGKEFNVGGKRVLRGLIRNAKDPQRMYNYWQSSDTEIVIMQPKSPYMITPAQLKGHEDQWKNAHTQNMAYMLCNPDPQAPGWPKREAPPQVSSAMVEKIRESDQEMRDTVGIQKAGLGMQSNERSGKAIVERKKEGDVGTFSFIDNLSRSLEHTGRVLIDVAPTILDTERIVRLGLDDGEYQFETVNMEAPNGEIFNDLSVGTYDVVVTVGPSFTTQRTEAKESMQEFIQYYPAAAPVIGDLYAKSMDWQGAEEVAERLRYLLPPEIRAELEAKAAKQAGEEVPPSASAPEPPPPDPNEEIKLQEAQVKLDESKVKLEQEQVKLDEAKVKLEFAQVQSKDGVKKLMDEIEAEDNEQKEE